MALEDYFPWVLNSEWHRGKDVIGHISVFDRSVGVGIWKEPLYWIVVKVISDGSEHKSRPMKEEDFIREATSLLRHLGNVGYNVSHVDIHGLSKDDVRRLLTPPKPDSEPSC